MDAVWRRPLLSSSLPVAAAVSAVAVSAVEIAARHRHQIVVETAIVLAADQNRAQIVRRRHRRRRPRVKQSQSVDGRIH